MRKIGQLQTIEQIENLYFILYANKIKSHYNPEDTDEPILWVVSDDDHIKAKKIYNEYITNTNNAKFKELIAGGKASLEQDQTAEEQKAKRTRYINARSSFGSIAISSQAPATMTLLAICILLFILSFFGAKTYLQQILLFSNYEFPNGLKPFLEIQQGQIWRLFTPALLHGDFFHLLFNAFWLYKISPPIEKQTGVIFYSLIIITIAVSSNTVYYFVAGPSFLGLSGVVYGLCGFSWAYSQMHPFGKIYLDPQTTKFLVIWYIICWFLTITDIMGIANSIHGIGAFAGVILGAAFALYHLRKQNLRITNLLKNHNYTILILIVLLIGGLYTDYMKYPRF